MVQWEVVKRTMHQRVFHHFPDGGAGKAEARVTGWTPWYSHGPKTCPSPSTFSSKVGMGGSAVSSATRSGMVA